MTTPREYHPAETVWPDAEERPVDDGVDSDDETAAAVSEAPMEADPADAAEQRIPVPFNEDDEN